MFAHVCTNPQAASVYLALSGHVNVWLWVTDRVVVDAATSTVSVISAGPRLAFLAMIAYSGTVLLSCFPLLFDLN